MHIGIIFRETVEYISSVNTAVEMPVADTLTTVHAGGVAVAEDDRYQKLILIGLTPVVNDVVSEGVVSIMALSLEEECIYS